MGWKTRDEQRDGHANRKNWSTRRPGHVDEHTDGQTNVQTDRQAAGNGWKNRRIGGQIDEHAKRKAPRNAKMLVLKIEVWTLFV